jgi:ubiquinone/menaquinone biosynthesis C-methylase UbiE
VSDIYDYPGSHDKVTYDLENAIADPHRRIELFMETLAPFDGVALADIGAGGGYHACLYARKAARVYALEPAPAMLRQLYARVAESGLANISILAADAENMPLRDNWVDVAHARFAYFFGPEGGSVRSCEPGIAEVMRILRPGGWFFIIDNALTTGEFAGILSRYGYAQGRSAAMQEASDAFYARHGFHHATVESTWTAPDRDALRRVMAMEFASQKAEAIMSEIVGTELSYHYRVYYRRK